MLSINNLTYYIGGRFLYQNASLHLNEKDKAGLVGINGSGKSSLLKIIQGLLKPESCEISMQKDSSLGILSQEISDIDESQTILTMAMQAFQSLLHTKLEIERLTKEISSGQDLKKIEKLSALQTQFELEGGYAMESKAEEILEGIGFMTKDLERPVSEFSGGWKMRVILAKLLLEKPSLLMLDEPTNHLDLPSIRWFEGYIKSYEGAVIIVSHDKKFLDNTVNKIIEIEDEKLIQYQGNYSYYFNEKSTRIKLQQNAYQNQQRKIKNAEKFITRFRAKATKARQVQSKIKLMEKIDLVENAKDSIKTIRFDFRYNNPSGKHVLEISDLSKSFGTQTIFAHNSSQIIRGDKIALIGANGLGKTTLLKIIAGMESYSGKCIKGYQVKSAYYAQHQVDSLDFRNNVIEELAKVDSEYTEQELRTMLGSFLFSGEDIYKKISDLSGGEKSRVALAKTLISRSNFLILDEPTNHLDIYSIDILIDALINFKGTLILVSHDRQFIDAIANKIWYIENFKIKEYPGKFSEYMSWIDQRTRSNSFALNRQSQKKGRKPTKNRNYIDQKNLKKKVRSLKNDLSNVEENIQLLEDNKKEIELKMMLPEIFSSFEKLHVLTNELEEINKNLALLHKNWENLFLALDDLETDDS